MQLDEAIKNALNGNGILFTGAGFSSGAKNIDNKDLITATDLSYYFCKELGIEKDDELEYTSELYIEKFGIDSIIGRLKNFYIASEVSNAHKSIINIPWHRIYTTNYDNVLEKSEYSINSKAKIETVTLSDDPRNYYSKNKLFIHLNGYIEKLDENKLSSEFKLTNTSYLTNELINSDWMELFREDIKNSKVVFFVGCSLSYDLDIKRVLAGLPNLYKKCIFITKNDIDDKSRNKMEKFGEVLKIGVNGFAEKINDVEKNYEVKEGEEIEFFNFDFFDPEEESPIGEIKDDDIFKLFKNGEFNKKAMKLSISNPKTNVYMIRRTKIETIRDDLIKHHIQLAIIDSDLGNGKTGLINMLKYELCKYGKVFQLKKASNSVIEEFEKIADLNEPVFIIIESYNLYLSIISKFKIYLTDNIKFVMTSRSLTNDVNYYNLITKIGIDEKRVHNYSINKLDDNEIEQLIDIFDEYSLWGTYSSKKRYYKKNRLCNLKSNFQTILLNFDSDYIKDQLNDIVNNIREKQSYYEVITLVLLNEVMERILDTDDLIYLLDSSLFYNLGFKKNPNIGEIIDFNEYCPRIKSSLTAKYILEKSNDSKSLIEILMKIAQKADKKTYIYKYKNLLRYLVSFSNIRYLLYYDKKNFNKVIIDYYEKIKNLNFNKRNSFFWLQYAIARLELKEYHQAEIYFNNAYSYATSNNTFDTIQIDTHYARFILENQLFSNNKEEAFEKFRQAHKLIMKVRKQKLHLHYPLRQTAAYCDYYLNFYDSFSNAEKLYFINACISVKNRIEEYFKYVEKSHRRKDRIVRECYNSLANIIEKEQANELMLAHEEVSSSLDEKNKSVDLNGETKV